MRYTVVWSPEATDQLADLWVRASDQQAVADAADDIDRRLRFAPDRVGTPHGEIRILIVEPLAVHFSVTPDDRLVEVSFVRRHL